MKKLWGGGFDESADDLVIRFTQSVAQDLRFWQEDVIGTVAHTRMLGEQGLITKPECEEIIAGLERIHEEGPGSLPKDAEDIHTAIELRLQEIIGDVAHKIAIARSRNDQVATSARLYLHNELIVALDLIKELQANLLETAKVHRKALMPGFTHSRPAQPITLGFYLLAHFWALQRDGWRAERLFEAANFSPMGAGAIAGTSLAIDREQTAKELGFFAPIPNALDAVSDRSFVLDALHVCTITLVDLSRLAQEIVLFSSPNYGFVTLSGKVTTGSIVLPQKRNPDVAELVRGRAAQAIGNYTAFAATLKGLPLGYNRDLQDDKPLLYRSLDLLKDSLRIVSLLLNEATWNIRAMAKAAEFGHSTALDWAEELVRQGVSFREAHEHVAEASAAGRSGKMPSARESVNQRLSDGGPGPKSVAKQIRKAENLLKKAQFNTPY